MNKKISNIEKSQKLKTGQFSPKTQKFQAAKITHYTVSVPMVSKKRIKCNAHGAYTYISRLGRTIPKFGRTRRKCNP